MKIGTYYYPEQWPRDEWTRDFDHMAAAGMELVHLAEFAWLTLEPEAGRFEFEWLDHCCDLARERGMDILLCTPTAAPPVWLTHDFPEVLPVDAFGRRARHGGRRHYNPLSTDLHEATTRIVTAMAEHFGGREGVIGWQVDNEFGSGFGSNGEGFDQSETTHNAFREWLRAKFGDDIDRLNAAWGNEFWNTQYRSFEQIHLPGGRNPGYANPHHHLDASRFWSRAYADYSKLQADCLRPHIGERFVTHNFMPFHPDTNPGDFTDSLSLYGWDTYPVTGWDGPHEDETFRLADPEAMEAMHDLMASHTGRWALLEVQPGQTNWSGFPVQLYPGVVRLWLWTALAHGAEFITVYRWRQPRVGQEMHHHGLVIHDGQTLSPGGEDFKRVAAEVKQLREAAGEYADYAPLEPSEPAAVGILFDFNEIWLQLSQPQAKRYDYRRLVQQWHKAIAGSGLDAAMLHTNREWPDGLKVIVVPGLQMVTPKTVERLKQFAEAGGHVIFTCRSCQKDLHGRVFDGPMAAPIVELIGANIVGYDALPDGMFGHAEMAGGQFAWGAWADQLQPTTAKVWATYADQFYKGTPAVTSNAVGGGSAVYCGPFDTGELAKALIQKVATAAGLTPVELPERVRLFRRGDFGVCLNYRLDDYEIEAPADATFLVGDRVVPPAGVSVWRA